MATALGYETEMAGNFPGCFFLSIMLSSCTTKIIETILASHQSSRWSPLNVAVSIVIRRCKIAILEEACI